MCRSPYAVPVVAQDFIVAAWIDRDTCRDRVSLSRQRHQPFSQRRFAGTLQPLRQDGLQHNVPQLGCGAAAIVGRSQAQGVMRFIREISHKHLRHVDSLLSTKWYHCTQITIIPASALPKRRAVEKPSMATSYINGDVGSQNLLQKTIQ
jgi:hypothetical protein